MDYPTLYPGVTISGSSIYSIAGRSIIEAKSYNCNLIQKYDIEPDTWSTLPIEYKVPVIHLGVTTLPNGSVLCFGGKTTNGQNVGHSYIFHGTSFTETGKVVESAGKQLSTSFVDPAVVHSGAVYIFSQTGELFVFKIATNKWEPVTLRTHSSQI
jgi:hypothetical protein